MTSGKPASPIALAAIALAATALAVTHANAHDEDSFYRLMEKFTAINESRVAYTEVKSLSILQSEVEQSGLLAYQAPATVIREVHVPAPETYTITGETLIIERAGVEERVNLDTAPQLRGFVESFRATLSGDADTLGRYYWVEYSADESRWEMILRPRSRKLARFIDSITFRGRGTDIDEILINEKNGDWSRMLLTPPEVSQDAH